jgi:hypothetical protein
LELKTDLRWDEAGGIPGIKSHQQYRKVPENAWIKTSCPLIHAQPQSREPSYHKETSIKQKQEATNKAFAGIE